MEQGAFIPMDQRWALAAGAPLRGSVRGTALVADLAGSTRLIDALVAERGAQAAAEALGRLLNALFTRMVDRIHGHRGSVTSFGGDALTAWFQHPQELAAVQCALEIRDALGPAGVPGVVGPGLPPVGVRLALCAGTAWRCVVGDPSIQRMEVLAGPLMARLAAAEHRADPGRVVVDAALRQEAGDRLRVGRSFDDERAGPLCEVEGLLGHVEPRPWGEVPPGGDPGGRWLHADVQDRLESLGAMFLDEVRASATVFLRFPGLDLQGDREAEERLDRFVRWAQGVFSGYEGVLLQVIPGDKGSYLYGSFGAPRTHEDDAARALEAASRLVAPPGDLGLDGRLSAGVSRGSVYAGAYGAASRRTYGVLGRDVHLAARLMEAAGPGEVLATRRIRDEAAGFRFDDRGALALKGLEKPVPVFALAGRARSGTAQRVRGGGDLPLQGRMAEMALLEDRLEALRRGEGGCVVVEGEAGLGKSRLVKEAWTLALARGLRGLAGGGESLSREIAYHAWRPVFESLLQVTAQDRRAAGDAVARALAALGIPASRAALLDAVLPVEAEEDDVLREMSAEVRAANARALMVDLLAAEARKGPLLLVLEDAHWLDGSSWTLLHEARRRVPGLLVLASARPGEGDAGAELRRLAEGGAQRIALEALPPRDVAGLACDVLGAETLNPALRAQVMDRCAGNPLLVREVVRDLLESGRVRVEGGVALPAGDGADVLPTVPRTVQDIIASRVDRLRPDAQALLKVACVVGPVFPEATVREVVGDGARPGAFEQALEDLQAMDLVFRQPGDGPPRYAFRHALLLDTVYNSLLASQRASLHGAVAAWWEGRADGDRGAPPEILALHWERAGDRDRALAYLDTAATRAERRYANDAAASFFARALALLGDDEPASPRRARWELGLGIARVNLLHFTEAIPPMERGLALLGHPVPRSKAGIVAGTLREASRQGLHRMLPRVFVGRDPAERHLAAARALERLAELHFIGERPLPAYYAGFAMLNAAETAGPSPELARAYSSIAAGLGFIPWHDAARFYFRRATSLLASHGDVATRAYVSLMAGYYEAGTGNWDEAIPRLEESLEVGVRLEDPRRQADSLSLAIPAHALRGNLEAAAGLADRMVAGSRDTAYIRNTAESLLLRGWLHLLDGRDGDAERDGRDLQETLRSSPGFEDVFLGLGRRMLSSELALRRGDRAEALATARDAIRVGTGYRPNFFSSLATLVHPGDLLFALWRTGLPEVQPSDLRQALVLMKTYADVFPIGSPGWTRLRAQEQAVRGRLPRALRLLSASMEGAARLGLPLDEAQAALAAAAIAPAHPSRPAWLDRAARALERPGCRHLQARLAALREAA